MTCAAVLVQQASVAPHVAHISFTALHSSFLQEDDVRDIFAPYGPLDLVQIQRDGAGKSQGHGYVT